MSTFKYDQKLALNEIRLIQLLPGDWLDGLEARLFLADRDHEYLALSYAWGSSKRSNHITVNDKIHRITFNLDRALRSIRRQAEPVILWIDSICINQDDAVEKGHQVGLMHDIFSWATEVIAYIGDGLDRSRGDYPRRFEKLGKNPFLEFLPNDEMGTLSLESQKYLDKVKDSQPGSLTEHEEIMCLYSLFELFEINTFSRGGPLANAYQDDLTHNLSEAQLRLISERMRHFATSDWWNRMWIVQEACVARQLTVIYGRASIPFAYVEHAAQAFKGSPATKHPDLARVMLYLVGKIDAIRPVRLVTENVGSAEHLTACSSLLWLLRKFRNRKSSEPRDKIFALLKLAEDMKMRRPFQHNKLTIETDYEVDVGELFSHAAYEIIHHTGLLWMTTPDLLAKSRKDIPSWVPDWSSEYMIPGFNQRRFDLQEETYLKFNASRVRFRHFRTSSSGDEFRNILPQQHFEGLLEKSPDRWKPVHDLPIMIKYTSSWPFENKEQRSALILKGVACGVVVTASDVIRSDLSNISFVIFQVQNSYERQEGWRIYRVPLLETIASCLSSAVQIRSEYSDYVQPLEPEKRREFARWTFRKLPRYFKSMNSQPVLHEEFYRTAADCPEGTGIDAIVFREFSPHLRFQVTTATFSNERQLDDELGLNGMYRLVRLLPEDFGIQEQSKPNDLSWKEDTIRTIAAGYRLFVTDRGQVGLGPENMRVGDALCVLEAGLMPYILRKHIGTLYTESSRVGQMESVMGTNRFTMVGTCYADGIMHWGDEAQGWADNADDDEEIDSKLRRRLNAPELKEAAFVLV
ncbi:heterokaryon incompatibility protein [Colletotrichum orchidophilum]|uniref:Heterokaryon incompatibility protein n=1 Tax=Colletotrichum orchidophilum TaxID=1209926 RepID=A0A1G4AQ35_9PEZI|nr:heterokaryon incompatibility protein [Colletotrichum orchidophilum]OHE91274.1 heterokaryon incompatibility protein [Colletotrichum orchidophilum]